MLVAKCSCVSLPCLTTTRQVFPSNAPSHQLSFSSNSKSIGKASFTTSCSNKGSARNIVENFSVLSTDIPWEEGSTWSTMGFYIFSLHIPLSFGGLSILAQMMHQPVLDPQTEAISILLIQTIELCGVLALLKNTAKPQATLASFLQDTGTSEERNWVLASAIGFSFLILLVLLTSLIADMLFGPKVVSNPILKEIMASGSVPQAACFLTYCLVTPFLEETVYRRFLLASLNSTMKWQQAVIDAINYSSSHSLHAWVKPDPGIIMLNCDGAWLSVSQEGGLGFVGRDSAGLDVLSGCGKLDFCPSALHSEAEAVYQALLEACNRGWKECDSGN